MALGRRRAVIAVLATLALLSALAGAYWAARRCAPMTTVEVLRTQYGTPASRYVDVDGVTVHYQDEGRGPVLLMLHGSFGSLHTFDELMPTLRGQFRVIRFDQPPTGLSGPVPEGFATTPEAFTRAFLERIGVSRVALFGTSSGGIFAYRFAATYPQQVDAVVLANIPPSAPVDNAAARGRLSWQYRLSGDVCARFARPWSYSCWEDFLRSMFVRQERVTAALVTRYYDLNRQPGARQLTSIAAIMRKDDEVRGYLSRVTAPTLLIWGSDSPVLPPDTADLLASRMTATRAQIVRLERVAHYPPLEAPDEVATATRDFLLRVLAAAPAGADELRPAAVPAAPR
jgi:pimeloyl-ACP methyl ester carboxylesterase